MIIDPAAAGKGAAEGIDCCLNILVPSLFPFMFLSSFAVMYGISDRLGKLLSPVTGILFNLPADAGVTILLSLVGGFPVGAVGINSLYKQGSLTQKQAQRMLCFCVNSGPGFLISVVGSRLYSSETAGIILTCAQITVSLLTGIVLGQLSRKKEPLTVSRSQKTTKLPFADSFISACRSACAGIAGLCSMVVLFSAFTELTHAFMHIDTGSAAGIIFRAVCEVTDGCIAIAENRLPIYLAALCAGFGGLCVHFQIFAALSEVRVSKWRFTLARAVNGILCAATVYLICRLVPSASEVFSNIDKASFAVSSDTYHGSAALLTASVLFVVFTGGIFAEQRK